MVSCCTHRNRQPEQVSWSSESCTATDWKMPVLVGIFTAQMLQDAHLTDIRAQREQSTPTDAADAETGQNALATPRVSNQQSAGASDRNDSAHQGEWVHHSGPRPGRAEMRMAQCAAIARAVRIEDAHTLAANYGRPHEVSGH